MKTADELARWLWRQDFGLLYMPRDEPQVWRLYLDEARNILAAHGKRVQPIPRRRDT